MGLGPVDPDVRVVLNLGVGALLGNVLHDLAGPLAARASFDLAVINPGFLGARLGKVDVFRVVLGLHAVRELRLLLLLLWLAR